MNKLTKIKLFVDIGNYELKFWDGRKTRAIRSIQFQLPQGRQPLEGKPNSPLIEYQGQQWHVGVGAYEYRKQSHAVEGDKSKNVLLSVLACCDFLPKEFQLSVRTSHPTPGIVAADIKKQLQGCHVFSRNRSKYIAHIEDVTVEPEGLGAWRQAKAEGLIPLEGYTILLDIGGGTSLTRLFNASGQILDQSVDLKGGAYDLASSISFDTRLTKVLGTRPHAGVIMDGFANGSHYYGFQADATWKPWLDEYLTPWFGGIVGAVKAQYEPQRARIVKFVLTGGSSMLIADRVKGLSTFAVIGDPRFANVRGMVLGEEHKQSIEAA
ncbi:MAG: ParM/StbA family protein [Hormoscilla sp.]